MLFVFPPPFFLCVKEVIKEHYGHYRHYMDTIDTIDTKEREMEELGKWGIELL